MLVLQTNCLRDLTCFASLFLHFRLSNLRVRFYAGAGPVLYLFVRFDLVVCNMQTLRACIEVVIVSGCCMYFAATNQKLRNVRAHNSSNPGPLLRWSRSSAALFVRLDFLVCIFQSTYT